MTRTLAMFAAAAAVAVGLSACAKRVQAPKDTGVCWHVQAYTDGSIKFNKVAENISAMELCAAELEGVRLRFLRLGGSTDLVGAYQGYFVFLDPRGIFLGKSLEGGRFLSLVRTGDGRLAAPGVVDFSAR